MERVRELNCSAISGLVLVKVHNFSIFGLGRRDNKMFTYSRTCLNYLDTLKEKRLKYDYSRKHLFDKKIASSMFFLFINPPTF